MEPASGQGTEFELSATDMMDSVVGIPKDPRHHHKAVGVARLRRVHDFFSMSAAKILTLVWFVVCSVVMRVHYRLFKHGTWFTHREAFAATPSSSPGTHHAARSWPRYVRLRPCCLTRSAVDRHISTFNI